MQQKLSQVNTKTNWDDIRKEQMRQIIEQGSNMTDDDVVYLKHCIKNFSGPTAYMWLESNLKGDQINEIIRHMKIATSNDGTNPIYFVQEGELTSKTRVYKKAEVVQNEEVEFGYGAIAFQVDRQLFNSFKNSTELQELELKSQNLQRCIPIRSFDIQKKQTMLPLFKETKKKFGSIMTVPEGGTASLYFQTKGTTLIFTSTKSRNLIIVGCIQNTGVFNEQRLLFEQGSEYGSISICESTLYQLQAEDVFKLPDDCIQSLRAGFLAKRIIYKSIVDKCQQMKEDDDFVEFQDRICKKYSIEYSSILNVIQKNTKNGKIESTDKQEQIEKNKQMFEKTIGGNRMNNVLSQMSDKERTLCLGTPRIVNKQSTFLGLTQEQETSLFALRQLATDLRKGNSNSNQIHPLSKESVNKAKQALLQEEKINIGEMLQRKTISTKLQEDPSVLGKMKKDNNELLSSYPQEEERILKIHSEDTNKESKSESETNNDQSDFKGRPQGRQSSTKGQQTAQQIQIDKKNKLLQSLV
ncbi:unnamed protein product (macronuclear) [Paramecium tetraurelia]|uniref:Cyclic nucleotide-binding domain-containing protein n=1 Tax=Paramecium tetraurelia TaxID=5888 RepID=A0CIS7_PARTE|nr:uncharacterized protein GSPATT00007829001 [Paramecium tetraurelia]CAK70694.1 unnamed protein product [Paramecium tetraurelia]|eukprot:XP_001438091.1 hypothetical protein (macronuclear) [Paramecium tetraurelia strain d4-2]